ncbi:MAG: hypothetical protein JWN32_822, partial [Solirubrobacterales bacterium]|nr:hypothetical protein [Solirubrobacterales bacterium]
TDDPQPLIGREGSHAAACHYPLDGAAPATASGPATIAG